MIHLTTLSSLLLVLFLHVLSLPVSKNRILWSKNHQDDKGYEFEYKSEDGSRRYELGKFIQREPKQAPVLQVEGFYSYFDDVGREHFMRYTADEKGTKTEGDFIPIQYKNSSTATPDRPLTFESTTLLPLPPLPPRTTTPELPPLEISSAALASLAGGGIGK